MKQWFGIVLLVALITGITEPALTGEQDVGAMLEEIRAESNLPALGGLAIVDGEVQAIGAVGLRKYQGTEKVTTDDKWHIGSCTKSMTATLAATFVEAGDLRWDSTIGEILGGKLKMREEYKKVTLRNLLTHRSGIAPNASPVVRIKAALSEGQPDIRGRRKKFAEEILTKKPVFKPGSDHLYSNSGYVIAGVMMETSAGKSWEQLMQERIFNP